MEGFFTAEVLFELVKEKGISIATIYRFLKQMREKNELYSYTCDNKLVYAKEKKSHCHFVCEETGKIILVKIKKYAEAGI